MKIGFLILSDASEALNGKLYALGAGWNQLTLPLPRSYQFGIGLGLDVPWEATNQRHILELHIEGPDGELLGDEPFHGEFEVGRPPGVVQGSDQRMVLSLGGTFEFQQEGPHAAVVRVDGTEIGRSRFYVVRAAAPFVESA